MEHLEALDAMVLAHLSQRHATVRGAARCSEITCQTLELRSAP
jgi:hypothetical protein